MAKQITLEEALELVDFWRDFEGEWYVHTVKHNCIIVNGNCGTVRGSCTIVEGDCGTVEGEVCGSINGRRWRYDETPREKLIRLIEDGASKEQLLEAFDQLEDN